MIFDYIDTATKISIIRLLRNMIKQSNLDQAIQIIKNQIPSDVADTMHSDDTTTAMLKFIAFGIITPVLTTDKSNQITLTLKAKTKWHLPKWVHDNNSLNNVNNHIEALLKATDDCDSSGVISAYSDNTMMNFRNQKLINAYPFEYKHPDLAWDMYLINTEAVSPQKRLREAIEWTKKSKQTS